MSAQGLERYISGTRAGHEFCAKRLPSSFFQFAEGNILVASAKDAPYFTLERVFVRGFDGLDPDGVFEIFAGAPAEVLGFQPLIVIPAELYAQGSEADPLLCASSEPFEPASDVLQAVPAALRFSESHHVENHTVGGKRFSRLTKDGVLARRAAEEAARQAAWQRQAEEAMAAAALRESEERRLNEQFKQQEEQTFGNWLGTLALLPDILVIDRAQFNPRVGQVCYPGVRSNPNGGYFVSCAIDRLPREGIISYGSKPVPSNSETADAQKYMGSEWDEFSFDIGDDRRVAALVPYTGPSVPLGSRVARPETLPGEPDEFLPAGHGTCSVIFEIVGNEYSYEVDDLFTIELALRFLMKRAPRRGVVQTVVVDDDDGDEERRKSTYQRRVAQSVEDRYAEYFRDEELIDGLDGCWQFVDWSRQDRKLLEAENSRRQAENAAWAARRDGIFARFFSVLGGTNSVTVGGACSYGAAGLRVELVAGEQDIDKIAAFLVRAQCQRLIFVEGAGIDEEQIRTEVLDELLNRYEVSKGNHKLFKARTNDMLSTVFATRFAIEGLVPIGDAGLLIGPSKLGKSVAGFNMCLSVAAGDPFGGLPTKKGEAVYISGEENSDILAERRARAGELGRKAGRNFLTFGADDLSGDIETDLALMADLEDLVLVVIDSAASYTQDTNLGGGARKFMQAIQRLAAKGCGVFAIHHAGKGLPAARARSARVVVENAKGSAEFWFAARYAISLHLESPEKNDVDALATGTRNITLHPGNMMPHVARLLNSIAFEMDRGTGVYRPVSDALVAVPSARVDGDIEHKPKKGGAKAGAASCAEPDARVASVIIQRLEKQLGKRLAFGGAKSLFKLKGASELSGWSRGRCEAAHRQAADLGLCRPA